MKTIYRIYTLMLCSFLLIGCNTHSDKPITADDNRTLITSENYNKICDMHWILGKMTIDGVEYNLKGERPFMKFTKDGKVSGHATINRFFGSVQVDSEGSVKWAKAFGSTRMAGPEEYMKQESTFLKVLPKTERLSREGIHLYVSTQDGQTELIFFVLP